MSLVFSAEDRANDPPALARKVLNLCHCHENTLMATTPAGPLSPYIPASAPRSADVVLYLASMVWFTTRPCSGTHAKAST